MRWIWRALRYLLDRQWRYRGDPRLADHVRRRGWNDGDPL